MKHGPDSLTSAACPAQLPATPAGRSDRRTGLGEGLPRPVRRGFPRRRSARPVLDRAHRGRSDRGGPSVGQARLCWGGDRTPRQAGRRRAARGRSDRGGDQPEPGEEPALALRLGRYQGRPVRRLRARRHAAHRGSSSKIFRPDV